MNISNTDLKDKIIAKLCKTYSQEESERIGDVILKAELSGRKSHGLVRLIGGYYDKVDPKRTGKPEIKQLFSTVSFVDGKFNSGILVLSLATDEAIRIGKNNAISLVGTTNTASTSGMISYYLDKIADAGLIGIVLSRAMAQVAGFGTKTQIFGSNPIGFAIPGVEPIILDMSTTTLTFGDLLKADKLGLKLPEGAALNKDGEPTTDPKEAIEGSTLPFDKSYKGAGLALIVEILAGLFTGGGYAKCTEKDAWGNLIITIKPNIFISGEEFKLRLHDYIGYIKSQKGFERLPGEKTRKLYNENIQKGFIEVDDKILDKLNDGIK